MRKSVRKFVGVALVGLLGALALPMLAAGAQTVPGEGAPPNPGECTFTATLANPPGTIPGTVNGSAAVPAGATVLVVTLTPNPGEAGASQEFQYAVPEEGGTIEFSFPIAVPSTVSANFLYGNENAYATGCTGPGGVGAVEISRPRPAAGPAAVTPAAQALAFTGSSDTPSYVLIGIAAIVVGAVLVVAARRRSQVS